MQDLAHELLGMTTDELPAQDSTVESREEREKNIGLGVFE